MLTFNAWWLVDAPLVLTLKALYFVYIMQLYVSYDLKKPIFTYVSYSWKCTVFSVRNEL